MHHLTKSHALDACHHLYRDTRPPIISFLASVLLLREACWSHVQTCGFDPENKRHLAKHMRTLDGARELLGVTGRSP